MYGNEGLKLAARRAFQFLKLRGSVGDEEAFVNKEHFLEMVLEEVGDNRERSFMDGERIKRRRELCDRTSV